MAFLPLQVTARAVRLKGSTFLQSPESPGMALDFRKVEELE